MGNIDDVNVSVRYIRLVGRLNDRTLEKWSKVGSFSKVCKIVQKEISKFEEDLPSEDVFIRTDIDKENKEIKIVLGAYGNAIITRDILLDYNGRRLKHKHKKIKKGENYF